MKLENLKILGIKHSGQLGDIVYSLSFIKKFIKQKNFDCVVIFVPSDKLADHAIGLNHVSGDLMMTRSMFDFIKPLLKSQGYIHEVVFLPEQEIPNNVLDLDAIRNGAINLSAGNIKSYYYKIYSLLDTDAGRWIDITSDRDHDHYDIVIGRSTRYINQAIDYSELNQFNCKIGFIGVDFEYEKLIQNHPKLSIQRINITNALEAASVISNSLLYIGNQSLFFAIAEALHPPRLLESYEPVPNVVPLPGNSGTFITTQGMLSLVSESIATDCPISTVKDLPYGYLLSY